jgi:YD repeat-containing protein
MTYLSPEAYNANRPQQGSIIGVFNSHGDEAKLSRDDDGTLTRIDSPNGGWIRFDYSHKHLVHASSSLKETADYIYDSRDRLTAVREPDASKIAYSYDAADRIIRVDDPSEDASIMIQYDDTGAVNTLTVQGLTYRFSNAPDHSVTVIDPTGKSTRVEISKTEDRVSYAIR